MYTDTGEMERAVREVGREFGYDVRMVLATADIDGVAVTWAVAGRDSDGDEVAGLIMSARLSGYPELARMLASRMFVEDRYGDGDPGWLDRAKEAFADAGFAERERDALVAETELSWYADEVREGSALRTEGDVWDASGVPRPTPTVALVWGDYPHAVYDWAFDIVRLPRSLTTDRELIDAVRAVSREWGFYPQEGCRCAGGCADGTSTCARGPTAPSSSPTRYPTSTGCATATSWTRTRCTSGSGGTTSSATNGGVSGRTRRCPPWSTTGSRRWSAT